MHDQQRRSAPLPFVDHEDLLAADLDFPAAAAPGFGRGGKTFSIPHGGDANHGTLRR